MNHSLAESDGQKVKTLFIGVDALGWQDFLVAHRCGAIPTFSSLINKGIVGLLNNMPGGQRDQWQSIASGYRSAAFRERIFWRSSESTMLNLPVRSVVPRETYIPYWHYLLAEGLQTCAIGWPWTPTGTVHPNEFPFYELGRGSNPRASTCEVKASGLAPNWVASSYAIDACGFFHSEKAKDLLESAIEQAESLSDEFLLTEIPALRVLVDGDRRHFLNCKYSLVSAAIGLELSLSLLKQGMTDFHSVVIWGYDPIVHRAHSVGEMKTDRKDLLQGFEPRGADIVIETLSFLDMYIQKLITRVPDDTNIVVVSNHGVHRGRNHNPFSTDAVFIANGPLFKQGFVAEGMRLTDIAPLLLRMYGLKSDSGLDDQVAQHILNEDFLKSTAASLKAPQVPEFDTQPVSLDREAVKKANRLRLEKIGF